MTKPKLAGEVNHLRYYGNPNRHDGALVYLGVTSASSAAPKEGLKYWAAREVATYAVSYSEQWLGLPAADAVDLLKNVPWRYRDRAAARGSEAHAVAERMINGEDYTVEAQVLPWVEALQRFVTECHPVPELMEVTCFNERHLHAGTFDFLGRLEAFPEMGRVLIDWKTGKDIYPDMGIQVVGGYALGAEYYLDDQSVEHDWHTPDTTLIVHLTPHDGYRIHNVPQDRSFRRAFLACLEIRRWEKQGAKIGPAFRAPEGWNLVYLRELIRGLDSTTALEVSTWCQENDIPTRPAVMTPDHIEQVIGFIKLMQMRETQPQPPALRPMP